MTRLQLLVLSALGGAPVLSQQPTVAACSSSIGSALALILFVYTAHGLVFASSVFFSLERRLKTNWLQRHTGQHLEVQSWGSCLLQRPLGFAVKALFALYPDGRLQKMYSRVCGQQTVNSSSGRSGRSARSVRCAAVSWLLLPLVLSVVWVLCLWFAEIPAVQHAASWCEREGIEVTPPCGEHRMHNRKYVYYMPLGRGYRTWHVACNMRTYACTICCVQRYCHGHHAMHSLMWSVGAVVIWSHRPEVRI
jgi:hypothetical protein